MTDSTPAYKISHSVYYAITKAGVNPSPKNKELVVGWQSVPYPSNKTHGIQNMDRASIPLCPDTGKEWSSVFLPNVTDAQWDARIQENPQIQYVTDGTDIFPAE